ncbi:MAG TPA: ribonuclease III [Anaerolineae bacterium]|nr:ribonuclease III [Anaerolineae bacterium]HIQ05850.1 ribonuclease III [Anaerolineae bacterium]
MENVDEFERQTGIVFRDKSLLQRALTHRSFFNESPDIALSDNERLEFLGDAVLDFLTAEYLYNRFPEMREGPLTNMRAALVRREALARFAQELDLGSFLLLGHGEAETGGRQRQAILAAAFEALVGALYLDQGLQAVESLIKPLMEPHLDEVRRKALAKDAKSRLQEWSQAELGRTPRYHTINEEGPDHAKEFTVEVRIGDVAYGQGHGRSKQAAAQAAAEAALRRLAANGIQVRPPGS